MTFAHCSHCLDDPVAPNQGHDIACQRPDCVAGRLPWTGQEPNRGAEHCAFRAMHRAELSDGQTEAGYRLGACSCGRRRIYDPAQAAT
jgi:hypothetical protein